MEHRRENIASAWRMQTVEENPSTDEHALASAAPAASFLRSDGTAFTNRVQLVVNPDVNDRSGHFPVARNPVAILL
jgi:hypothetical protein